MEPIKNTFIIDKAVSPDILKQDSLVKGAFDNTSSTTKPMELVDRTPVKAINDIPLFVLNAVSILSVVLLSLLNSLSFTQNWSQPFITVTVVVLIATPIVIQSFVSIRLISSVFKLL